jgi:FKBP-type peptidyl-prolyl cis-trans isomerase
MKKNLFFALVFVAFLGVSCSSFLDNEDQKRLEEETTTIQNYAKRLNLGTFEKSPNGVYYLITRKNLQASARTPKEGDEITMHYVLSIMDGAKLDSSSTLKNEPKVFPFALSVFRFAGFYESFTLLKEGEKGIFLVPSSLAYGGGSSSTIPAYSIMRLDIDLLKLRTEDQQIEDYIKTNNLKVEETTSTGLRYISITKNAAGVAMNKGRSTTVKYVGSLLNGKTFDSGQLDLVIGGGSFIKGFDEALLKMRVGEKAKFILPSSIAYGVTGNTGILPYSPLVFDLEIIK